jgi:hypothetical protein
MVVMVEAVPGRTDAQRLAALVVANEVRVYRAGLKRDVKAGRVRWTVALDDGMCVSMKVVDLLMAVPKVGRVKAHKVLVRCRVSPSKSVGGLTERQRAELVAALPGGRRGAIAQTGTEPRP